MPAFTVCPAFEVAYERERLKRFGIASERDYKKGEFYGNSSDAREVFSKVTHDLTEILYSV